VERRKFGGHGPAVSVIGQGTWNLDRVDRHAAVAALRRGHDLGMTHIDTAEMYGDAEIVIAEATEGRRDEIFLVSKVLPSHASRSGVIQACERSLRRLRTDRLDCYLLHWRGSTPLAETIAAFETLKESGQILSWGVSNFDENDLEDARRIAGDGKFACNQVLYHLDERAIVAYSPFGSGRFPGADTAAGRVLAEIAASHDATPRQVALAFLTRRKSLFAIPKAASLPHIADNAAAGDLALSAAEIARIDAAFPRGPKPRNLPMI
jgi:diketogulonate reductase-like aldo/keto reductase